MSSPKYLMQKVVGRDKLPKQPREKLTDEYLREHYYFSNKYDGIACIMRVEDGPLGGRTVATFTRTGEHIVAFAGIREQAKWLRSGVYFGELWSNTLDQATVSGYARTKDFACDHSDVVLKLFDYVSLSDYERGYSDVPHSRRNADGVWMPRIHTAVFRRAYDPATRDENTVQSLLDAAVSNPRYDGIVASDPSGMWSLGPAKDGQVIKFKRAISYDLECVGMEEGKGKHSGRMGALLFRYRNGVTLKVGIGFSDDFRESCMVLSPVGNIGLIEAMAESSKGSLREPRFKWWRFDKEAPDF